MNNIKVTLINPITDKDLSLISDAAQRREFLPRNIRTIED